MYWWRHHSTGSHGSSGSAKSLQITSNSDSSDYIESDSDGRDEFISNEYGEGYVFVAVEDTPEAIEEKIHPYLSRSDKMADQLMHYKTQKYNLTTLTSQFWTIGEFLHSLHQKNIRG